MFPYAWAIFFISNKCRLMTYTSKKKEEEEEILVAVGKTATNISNITSCKKFGVLSYRYHTSFNEADYTT